MMLPILEEGKVIKFANVLGGKKIICFVQQAIIDCWDNCIGHISIRRTLCIIPLRTYTSLKFVCVCVCDLMFFVHVCYGLMHSRNKVPRVQHFCLS